MSAQLDSMCVMDISGGCETQQIPSVDTKKHAFIPCTRGCRRRRKLLPHCSSSRTIQRCLTSGPFGTGWPLRRTAKYSAVSSDRLAMGMQTKCTSAHRAANHLNRLPPLTAPKSIRACYLRPWQIDVLFCCGGPGLTERGSDCICITATEEQSETV